MQTAAGSSPARGSAFFKISRDGRDGLRCRFDSGERRECDRAAPPHVLWRVKYPQMLGSLFGGCFPGLEWTKTP